MILGTGTWEAQLGLLTRIRDLIVTNDVSLDVQIPKKGSSFEAGLHTRLEQSVSTK